MKNKEFAPKLIVPHYLVFFNFIRHKISSFFHKNAEISALNALVFYILHFYTITRIFIKAKSDRFRRCIIYNRHIAANSAAVRLFRKYRFYLAFWLSLFSPSSSSASAVFASISNFPPWHEVPPPLTRSLRRKLLCRNKRGTAAIKKADAIKMHCRKKAQAQYKRRGRNIKGSGAI